MPASRILNRNMWKEVGWDAGPEEFRQAQEELGRERPEPWRPEPGVAVAIGAVFACFERRHKRPWEPGEEGWSAYIVGRDHQAFVTFGIGFGRTLVPYEPGMLGLREGALLESAVRLPRIRPDVLMVNATGRDHPRRAGLALHLGAKLDLPTVGITQRPLLARGAEPGPEVGDRSPLLLEGELVGYWLRTSQGAKPMAVHAAWRTDAETAVDVVLRCDGPYRTPIQMRGARQLARAQRSAAESRLW
jgi:deoxyribonuclease V